MISHLKFHKAYTPKSIFVLDDWPDVLSLFKLTGRKHDLNVIGALSNEEALSKFDRLVDKKALHVAFIDVQIGTDSGLDVYEIIRSRMPRLPIIIMTGRPDNKTLIDLVAGETYTSFLSKPFFKEEISEIIRNPCAKAGDVRELIELSMFIEETHLL